MKHRFTVLDIFRGIFASFIVFAHMSAFSNTPILNNSFIHNAGIFVDFFFVLSGFVICYSYERIPTQEDLKLFLKKRIYRLYPLHIIMLLIFLLMEGVKILLQNQVQINNSLQNNSTTFFSSLFLLNSIKFPGVTNLSWNMVSWSISAELISYVLYGVICLLLEKNKNYLKCLAYLAVSIFALLAIFMITESFKIEYTFDYGFLRGMIGFFFGAVCFTLFKILYPKLKDISSSFFNVSEILMLILVFYFTLFGEKYGSMGYLYEVLFFISILIFSFEKGIISTLLNKVTLLKNIGKYSYSIYMTHTLLISIFNVFFIRLLKLPNTTYSYLFILNFIVVYFVASFTYKHVEMRFNFKSRKK